MLKAVIFGLCLLGASNLALAEKAEQDGRLLSVFNVVTFPNDVCAGNSLNGTCFTEAECSSKGGASQGTCAEGFGVCCVFELACGESSSANNTYLVQAASSSITSPCRYEICPTDSNICRIRFDFTTNVLSNPLVGTGVLVGATTTLSGAGIGDCLTDSMSITGGSSSTPAICGANSGQHMIVNADSACHNVDFTIGGGTTSRQWNIWVTQYTCGDTDNNKGGPPGCLQYFTGTTGYVRSFNFPTGTTTSAATTHLSSQQYVSCIRREIGVCFICYTPIGTTSTTSLTAQSTFGVSVGGTAGTANGLTNSDCVGDYIQIPGGAATPGTVTTTAAIKICGRAFASIRAQAAHATVCTRQAPFTIAVDFDADEVMTTIDASMTTTNEQQGTPGGIIGFGLIYAQSTTGC